MPVVLRIRTREPSDEARDVTLARLPATIGRGEASDLRLDHESVSVEHAAIERAGDRFIVRDCGSTNGTLVGGVRVVASAGRLLGEGDVLRIGIYWIQFHAEATVSPGDLSTNELALGMISKALAHLPREHCVEVVEGEARGQLVELPDEEAIVFGRDKECAVRFASGQVSREHVRARRQGDDVFVRDAGSRNGTYLGDAAVPRDREVPWNPVAHVRAGDVVLALAYGRPRLETLLGHPVLPNANDEAAPPSAPSHAEPEPMGGAADAALTAPSSGPVAPIGSPVPSVPPNEHEIPPGRFPVLAFSVLVLLVVGACAATVALLFFVR